MATNNDETIRQLDSFLRGEISAVETYRQALQKVTDPKLQATLHQNQSSHQARVGALSTYIRQRGGNPSESSGAWGAFAKFVEGTAKLAGDASAISALEEGEDHGLRDYRDGVSSLDPTTRAWVEQNILGPQEQTHAAISQLKHALA